MSLPPIHLHLIAYSQPVRDAIAPGWLVLDNLDNERPDWFEYWPIRRFLRDTELDDEAFYGFFSPKFSAKTGLGFDAAREFVAAHAHRADVLLFSPQPDMGAFFLNVFEQGETFDHGLIDAYGAFLSHIGRPAPLRQMVMDARQVCFGNYFVARPSFWREWLALNEALFAVCEGLGAGAPSALRAQLTHTTTDPGAQGSGTQRKVFLQERACSLLLATQPRWRSVPYDPFGMGWSASRLRDHPHDAFASDALKRAFRDTGWPHYMQAFAAVRERFATAGTAATRT